MLLGAVDFVTGPQVAFSVFYLLPVSLAEWKSGARPATMLAALAAATWLIADLASGQEYDHAWIAAWNSGTRFVMFMIVVRLLASLRTGLDVQTKLATLDYLTSVLNPRALAAATEKIMEQARRERVPFTFAYVDLDDFKQINDRLGHTGGDQALTLVAETLQANLRSTDIVGRLGGDEFGLVLPATGSEAAKRVMDDLVARVQRGVTEMPIEVTFSVGAVTFLVPPRDIDEVIKASDQLMYGAKSDGKNRYRHDTVGLGLEEAAPDETAPRGPRSSLERQAEGTTRRLTTDLRSCPKP